MYIETRRMALRNFKLEDINDLQEIFGDAKTMENVEPAYDIDKTTAFLKEFCIDAGCALAAVHKVSGKLIGYLLFKPYRDYREPEVYEIGWIFNKDYWRNGYAYEACRSLIEYAFSTLDAHKLFAEAIDNVKSVGLMKKLGMQLEGVQRKQTRSNSGEWADLYFYGILKEDFYG